MLVVQGGRPLAGTVQVAGAKNAALPLMAATLAVPGHTVLQKIPFLRDISSMEELLRQLGLHVWRDAADDLHLESTAATPVVADYELVRKMRASVCVLGPLLASRGSACVSLPGGCNIGHRPIDLHLRGLAALGADISLQQGYVVAEAKRLRGARVHLGGPQGSTVTGTCNVLTAAVLAEGTTVIEAAACEPEVVDLGNFLQSCGAKIEGLGTNQLIIDGVSELTPVTYQIIPDRIEAATWLIAAAITRGELRIENCQPGHLQKVLTLLRELGMSVEAGPDDLQTDCRQLQLLPGVVEAAPYPDFPTDVQAQITALLCTAPGVSRVTDTVFPDRFMHASELIRMGANIQRQGNRVMIQGGSPLLGANVMASDLRASAALVLAALAAEGKSAIRRIYHLDRGYEKLAEKLTALGADIQRLPESAATRGLPGSPPHARNFLSSLPAPHVRADTAGHPTAHTDREF